MWIGSCQQNMETPLGLKWCDSIKALGIAFMYIEEDLMQKMFYDKLKDIRLQTRLWSCCGLSLYGKITIIKWLLLQKMLYVFSILPTSRDFIKQLNTIISNFLWKGPGKIPVVRQMQLTIWNLVVLMWTTSQLLTKQGKTGANGGPKWRQILLGDM